MKLFRKIKVVAAVAVCLVTAAVVDAQDYFSLTGTAQGATNSYSIVPKNTGIPCVFFLDASILHLDNTNGVPLVSYVSAAEQLLTRAGTTGTNTLYYAASNGWAVGDVLILSRAKESAFERHTVSTVSSTNLTITGTTAGPTVAGDKIYRQTAGARLVHMDALSVHALGPGSLRIPMGGQPIFSGQAGRPMLVEMQGTRTNTLNTVSGRWLSPSLGK